MLSDTIEEKLNQQSSKEFAASNNYLAKASWCEVEGYEGAAKYFYAQSDEERMHGLKLFHYINGLEGKAIAPKISQPPLEFDSFKALFEESLKQEQETTKSIHELVQFSLEEKDYGTYNFMHWYLDEQVEEENKFRSILDKFKIIGDDRSGLYLLDKDLGAGAGVDDAPTQE